MSKPFTYECHVTLRPKDIEEARRVAHEHKWKTSVIVGDEQTDDVKYVYCTAHDESYSNIFVRMCSLVRSLQVPVMRRKIEHILFDEDYRNVPRYEVGEIVEVLSHGLWIDAKVEALNNGSITTPENITVRPLPDQGFQQRVFPVEVGDYRKKT